MAARSRLEGEALRQRIVPSASRVRDALASTALALCLVLLAAPESASAVVFANPGSIQIPLLGSSGPASPYPSEITVSGLTGAIVDVDATILDYDHAMPEEAEVLLVGPFGQNVVLTGGVGASPPGPIDLTFDDAAASSLTSDTLASGSYKPTFRNGFFGPPPAPSAPYGSQLSIFNGTLPNGVWKLFVYDDGTSGAGTVGSIAGGWSLDIRTDGPSISSFTPSSGPPGTSVNITGEHLTDATAVGFGGASASFVVNPLVGIVATVPAGATTGPVSVTTPKGTATSSTDFVVTSGPGITTFSPDRGKVGDQVTITGVNLTGAVEVAFDGTPAATITVDSPTQITATVPAGAGTGPLSVTTPSGTGSSALVFVVKHGRSVSLSVGGKARGTVGVTDGFAGCGRGVPVKVQHREAGRWRTVGSDLTNASGAYAVPGTSDPGRYRAMARKVTLASGDVCLKDVSPVAKR